MKNPLKAILALSLLAATAPDARALSIFGGDTASRLKSADRLLEKADAAFEGRDFGPASNGYARALEKYHAIEKADPGYGDGLPSIRVAYCMGQLALCAAPGGGAEEGEAAPKTYGTEESSAALAFQKAAGEVEGPAADGGKEEGGGKDAAGDAEEAAEEAPRGAYDPRNFVYDFNEARELIDRGKPLAAIGILTPMVHYDPGNRQVRMLLAAARVKAGQDDLAIAALEDLRGKREDLPLLLLISGAYVSAGRYPDALLSLDAAVKLAPADPAPYIDLAWLTVASGGRDAAKVASNYYSQALKRGAARDAALEARLP